MIRFRGCLLAGPIGQVQGNVVMIWLIDSPMADYISHDHEHDGIDRRGFLQCMAWAGTGLL
jgi:hypothetical protein